MRSRTRETLVEDPDPGPPQTDKVQIRSEPSPDRVLIQTTDPVRSGSSPVLSQRTNPKEEKENRCGTSKKRTKTTGTKKNPSPELSQKDLLHLLGVMEGEVQARDDVIALLHSHCSGPDVLEAHYGSATPYRPLQALQRDGALTHDNERDDVYEAPMAELERLEQKQRDTYRRMLEQLLLVEKLHRRTVSELDSEKQKHKEFMCKSDDFTQLLEQDRLRLKRLVEQEKSYQSRKEKEHGLRFEKLQSEVSQLRAFVLLLVDERQKHAQRSEQRRQKIQELTQMLQEWEQHVATCNAKTKEDAQTILKLEAELEQKSAELLNEQEDMTNKLLTQDSQMRQLRLKLVALSNRIEELEERNKVLQSSERDLKQLTEDIGTKGSPALASELETLRKKVVEMEGKDEELVKMESQCKEFKVKLQDSQNQSSVLKLEMEKVQKGIAQMEKLEAIFDRSKAESSQLRSDLDKEKQNVKGLSAELEVVKAKVKELQSAEAKFDETEKLLKADVAKLKSLAAIVADERKSLAERLKREEEKCEENSRRFKEEQAKVSEITEKLIEGSKKCLKVKSEMEERVAEALEKLTAEQEKCKQLNANLNSANAKIDELEGRENDLRNKLATSERNSEENSRLSEELSLEISNLQGRLKRLEIVEGDLAKTGDEYGLLERRFRSEQERSGALARAAEDLRAEMTRSKAVEKGEVETELRMRFRAEEEKNEGLRAENATLKEKVHELMNAEDRLAQLQAEQAATKRRLREEEEVNARRRAEFERVTQELENMRRFSRVSRPSVNGRRMVDVPVTSAASQTEWSDDETAAGFIRKSVQEENSFMNRLRQKRAKPVLDRYPFEDPPPRCTWAPCVKPKPAPPETRPLRIRFTPSENQRATLEIAGPKAEEFFSSATVMPTLRNPKITIVPKATAAGSGRRGSERAQSPVTITAVSRTPERNSFRSPVSIITVSTAPVNEAAEGSRSVFTTEDKKIHIHLGAPKSLEKSSDRSPAKKSSSIMITPTNGNARMGRHVAGPDSLRSQPGPDSLRSQPGPDSLRSQPGPDSLWSQPGPDSLRSQPGPDSLRSQPGPDYRIPVPRPVAPVPFLGLSSFRRLESRAESLKIELRKFGSGPNAGGRL